MKKLQNTSKSALAKFFHFFFRWFFNWVFLWRGQPKLNSFPPFSKYFLLFSQLSSPNRIGQYDRCIVFFTLQIFPERHFVTNFSFDRCESYCYCGHFIIVCDYEKIFCYFKLGFATKLIGNSVSSSSTKLIFCHFLMLANYL